MSTFPAFRIHSQNGGEDSRLDQITVENLSEGDVLIRVQWSCINYKDALAATGAGKIMRRFPLIGGIDLAGVVESSADDRFSPGQSVLITSSGLGENHDGGYARYARVPGDWVLPLPEGFSTRDAMAMGTAGFTAALAVHRMEVNGQRPEHGPVAVTGATGGVGSVAVDILSGRGYEVAAITGKTEAGDYLSQLGAAQSLARDELEIAGRPLESTKWGGAVDNLGGEILAWLVASTREFGNVASIGLAASHTLDTTVMPFILRGVSLLGINSVTTPRPMREEVWARIATDLKPRHLDEVVTREITLDNLPGSFDTYLKGQVTGRTLVRIGD